MTLELRSGGTGSGTGVEALLADLLDREWLVQSARTQPLWITPAIRERIELALAGSPRGVFSVARDLDRDAESPEELLGRIRDRLPAHADVWTTRLMRRLDAVPPPAHPSAHGLLDPSVPEPAAMLEAPAPDRPADEEPEALAPALPARIAPTPPEPEARGGVASPWLLAAAAACGAGSGAALGLVNELTVEMADPSVGAVAGAVAGVVGALACRLSRSPGRAR